MLDGICRVCGSPLAAPLVTCPACETPHHRDCWDYNRGCSIYGCSPPVTLPALADLEMVEIRILPVVRPWHQDRRARILMGYFTGILAFAWWSVGVYFVLEILLIAGIFFRMYGPIQFHDEEEEERPVTDPRVALDLETKSVAALVGTGVPDQVAQAYALFEQRNPRASLAPARQKELSFEILDRGYWAIGLEALEKALHAEGMWEDPELRDRRWRAYARDLAYLQDAFSGPSGPAQAGKRGLEAHLDRIRELLPVPRGPGEYHVVSLAAGGWGQTVSSRVTLPGRLTTFLSTLLAGPGDLAEVKRLAHQRWVAGHPCLILPTRLLELPETVREVQAIHLSHKEARLVTSGGEAAVGWRDVRAIIWARIDTVRTRTVIDRESGTSYSSTASKVVVKTIEETDSRPILEIHVGYPPMRYRIDALRPGLYDYLGRRREASHTSNLALVAKDFARFAPRARASHGLTHLLSERAGAGYRFKELERFEEYVIWFAGLGSPAVQAIWEPLLPALAGTVAATTETAGTQAGQGNSGRPS